MCESFRRVSTDLASASTTRHPLTTISSAVTALLVSDREREATVGLLRKHWLSGRLTSEEFEQRVDEALRARLAEDLWRALRFLPLERARLPARPAGGGTAVASLVIGLLALFLLMISFGLFFLLTLPLAVTAWALGREARRSGNPSRRDMARAGEILGIVATALSGLMLAGCAAIISSL
jgi:ABC-type multidrug transport system fused ATPase/permease subunit